MKKHMKQQPVIFVTPVKAQPVESQTFKARSNSNAIRIPSKLNLTFNKNPENEYRPSSPMTGNVIRLKSSVKVNDLTPLSAYQENTMRPTRPHLEVVIPKMV